MQHLAYVELHVILNTLNLQKRVVVDERKLAKKVASKKLYFKVAAEPWQANKFRTVFHARLVGRGKLSSMSFNVSARVRVA